MSWKLTGPLVVLKFLIAAAFLLLAGRWAQARVVTDRHGVTLHNLERNLHVSWSEIGEFLFSRRELFLTVLRLSSGRRRRIDGLATIGFPFGPTVGTVKRKVSELNAERDRWAG